MEGVCWRPRLWSGDRWEAYEEYAPDVAQQAPPTILFVGPGASALYREAEEVRLTGRLRRPLALEVVDPPEAERNGGPECAMGCGRAAAPASAVCCLRCGRGGPGHGASCVERPRSPYGAAPDENMSGWQYGPRHWRMEEPNLASFGRDVVLPRIREMALEGRGPSAVVCGSRASDVTVQVVWEEWRGPTLTVNASCLRPGLVDLDDMQPWYRVPEEVPLFLAAGGRDWYFAGDGAVGSFNPQAVTASRESRQRLFGTSCPVPDGLAARWVLLYFSHLDGHGMQSLQGGLLAAMLELIASGGPPPAAALAALADAIPGGPGKLRAEVVQVERPGDLHHADLRGLRVQATVHRGARVARVLGPGEASEGCWESCCSKLSGYWQRLSRCGDREIVLSGGP